MAGGDPVATDHAGSPGGISRRLIDLEEDVRSLRSQFANLRVEWTDTLGSLVKIGNKINAQGRRDLQRAAAEGEGTDQLTLHAPAPAAQPKDRASIKAQLRARAQQAAILLAVALAYLLDQANGIDTTAQLAFLPLLASVGSIVAKTGVGKSILGKLGGIVTSAAGKVFGKSGGAVVEAATAAVGSKLARRVAKGTAAAVATGAAFEVGARVVRGPGTEVAPAVFNPGTGVMAAAGQGMGKSLVEVAPGIFSDGKSLRMDVNGRMRRISGFDVFGQPKLRRPQMNVLNPQALGRANRRLVGFGKFAKRTLAQLASQSRAFGPPRARACKTKKR